MADHTVRLHRVLRRADARVHHHRDLRLLDEAFPPPTRKRPLEMI